MADVSNCPLCKKELIGHIEKVLITMGNFVYFVSRDTPDCNWHRCKGCKSVLCKSCYAEQHTYCCDEDRIVCRERAQAIADREFQQTQEQIWPPETQLDFGGINQNQNTNKEEENMSDFKIVYLIVERGVEPNRQVFWRSAGSAFICRDGSLNVKLDIHPGLIFNIRDPKSNGERIEAVGEYDVAENAPDVPAAAVSNGRAKKKPQYDDPIPF